MIRRILSAVDLSPASEGGLEHALARSAAGRLILGSVAERVARTAPVPVVTVPGEPVEDPTDDATRTTSRGSTNR